MSVRRGVVVFLVVAAVTYGACVVLGAVTYGVTHDVGDTDC